MTMTTAYVLTAGEYSDYHIIGVFSNKKDAAYAMIQLDIDKPGLRAGSIEEFLVDAFAIAQAAKQSYWYVVVPMSDRAIDTERASATSPNNYNNFDSEIWEANHCMRGYVWAGSAEEAINIVKSKMKENTL